MKLSLRFVVPFMIVAFLAGALATGASPNVTWGESADPADAAVPSIVEESASSFVGRVNIPERRLRIYSVSEGTEVNDLTPVFAEYRVAVGRKRYPTPVMDGAIVSKRPKPAWYVPRTDWAGELAGQVVPFSSRENPFRARNAAGRIEGYFLALGQHGIGLHSTREARSIGRLASHGCIRMNLDDVRTLYHMLPQGTPVSTVYRLYRIEKSAAGLKIRAFEDVYRRFNRERRLEELEGHLARHGLTIEILRPEELERLLSGDDVELAGVTPHRIVSYEERTASSDPVSSPSGPRDAASLLARTVLAMPR